jgi:hypothetical protein
MNIISSFNSFLEPESILNDKNNTFCSIDTVEEAEDNEDGYEEIESSQNMEDECGNSKKAKEILKKEIKNLLTFKMELPSSYCNRMIINSIEAVDKNIQEETELVCVYEVFINN